MSEVLQKATQMALAGLFHDIGKVALRAGEKGASRTFDAQARQDYGHFHALLTHDFIQKYLPSNFGSDIKHWAAQHHAPQQREHTIIALADRLSAGERADPYDDEKRAGQPKQLLSIFSVLTADGLKHSTQAYWPLRILELDERSNASDSFPGAEWSESAVQKAYTDLWEDFCKQVEALKQAHEPQGDLLTYLETMLLLMQRYFWAVPSAYYKARPDISLYDHSRMTATLAAILAKSTLPDEALSALAREPETSEETIAVLIGGDLSGVQDFIYTITNRGATSALRGRSFYLTLLTEAVARYVLGRLDLPPSNIIYAGGGNFYLLARPEDLERLTAIRRDLSRIFYIHHRGDLYMALAGVPLEARDFFGGRISKKWEEVGRALQRVKQRRFAELPPGDLARLFAPEGRGGDERHQCQVCGRESEDIKVERHGAEEVYKCKACLAFEEDLGEPLRNAQYLVLDFEETLPEPPQALTLGQDPTPWSEVLKALGLHIHLVANGQDLQGLHPPKGRRLVLALSQNALQAVQPGARIAVGRRFLVNVAPLVRQADVTDYGDAYSRKTGEHLVLNRIKPFDLLEMQAGGIQRLGVLRMDVDNLGKLFAEGLGNEATLSRVANLSFAISLYFEGWVGVLAQRRNAHHEVLYTIYSGGDDLFFVGAWDEVVELALDIRRDLTLYAANHPGIHASAGLVLIDSKYPLAAAAREAGEAEEQAKGLHWYDAEGRLHTKDAITFLGQSLPWVRFGLETCAEANSNQTAHSFMHFLTDLVSKDKASRALVRLLMRLYAEYRSRVEVRRQGGRRALHFQPLWGRWDWLFVYYLARAIERNKSNAALKQRLGDLQNQMSKYFHDYVEWTGLAARWAELRLRKNALD